LRSAGETDAAETTVELQGVDVASSGAVEQRWFGVAGEAGAPALSPHPADPWWRAFAGVSGSASLLRMEQWFTAGPGAFRTGLAGGALAFDGRRSVVKQWLDVSGASLVALRIRAALR